MSLAITCLLRVHGRVQGVGYRQSLLAQAEAHGLTGWVRNRSDGTVEAVLQGSDAAVRAVVEWARRGPPAARVERVESMPASGEHDQPYRRFEWRATL